MTQGALSIASTPSIILESVYKEQAVTEQTMNRVALRADVEAILNEVFADWMTGNGSAIVTCVYDIVSGPCCDFAGDVVDRVLQRFPDTEIDVEDYEDYLNLDGLTANGIHYYVKLGNWYFDAARPEGVPSPDYLPTCKEIRQYASSIGGSDDLEDDDTSEITFN